ncbi:MAG: hypothetical protein DRJ31_04100 [Candidatus Methanomethylicota archaeon]|uniref:Winged helix DNA-binding domain-containing protein n=2 Tax=Thermoproteota archaeon TaxID=2056631 RepID=A0A497ER42_9CREN|nr:MAG: hypothetical protein DRJ31_04100 [Candidatus Verstraetearchaeota archaeon]
MAKNASSALEMERLNPELMNAKRFLIATTLYLFGPKTEAELVKALSISWGDLDSNLRRLREKGYVEEKKVFTSLGPRTVVKLTDRGVQEYAKLVEELKKVLSHISSGEKLS